VGRPEENQRLVRTLRDVRVDLGLSGDER